MIIYNLNTSPLQTSGDFQEVTQNARLRQRELHVSLVCNNGPYLPVVIIQLVNLSQISTVYLILFINMHYGSKN